MSAKLLETQGALHTLEAANERLLTGCYGLDEDDVQELLDETGTPAGWQPLIQGYATLPRSLNNAHVAESLLVGQSSPMSIEPEALTKLRERLRGIYVTGPGPTREIQAVDEANDDDENPSAGGRIEIPTETFLEELSQKLKIHPISVYWLLKEMREEEGLVSPPELKRQVEDYVSVTILRLLGYRWPEQDAYEQEHGPILDSALLDADGIIPLVACGDELTAAQRVRQRLERDFGEEGAEQSERELRQWVGRSVEDWLRRDFFKRHVQQFKQRPIAWHLVSPERTFEALVLYHRLSRATLRKLRAQYAGGLIARLRAEQERARQAKRADEVSRLQLQIEDVDEFRARLEKIERGDELKYRIRCRWKDEEQDGRPGPYNPDIDDGVKVNIRPFQEAGLLAVREAIKKW